MEGLLHKLLAEQLGHYRLQRHDFLNHCQVVRGYLQLNMPDKALSYLTEGLENMEAEQQIGQVPQPLVGAILLGLVVGLKKEGIGVEVKLGAELKRQEFWEKKDVEEYGEAFYGYTKECLEEAEHAVQTFDGAAWPADRCLKAAIVFQDGFEDGDTACSLSLCRNEEAGNGVVLLEKKYKFN